MSLVIVGEDNPYGSDPQFALYHLPRYASGNRLREILGLTDVQYHKLSKMNLCNGSWNMKHAMARVLEIIDTYDTVICLGSKVRTAFELLNEFFRAELRYPQCKVTPTLLLSIPHPSARNRIWSNPDAKVRVRELVGPCIEKELKLQEKHREQE